MLDKTLYIIGNGFDLFHGLKSSYSDFKCYLEIHNPDVFETVQKYIDPALLWSDFETSLAYLDTDELVDDALQYLESYSSEDWSDAFHHDYQYEIDKALDAITSLVSRLSEWIASVEIPKDPPDGYLALDKTAHFLSFNYTSTLEYLYRIPAGHITYLHNRVIDAESELVLGHGRNITKEPFFKEDEWGEDDDVRVREGAELIHSYFKETFKNTSEVIEQHTRFFADLSPVEDVYILGHSLKDIDLPYYIEVVKHVTKACQWHVTYYTADEKYSHRNTLESMGVARENIDLIDIEYLSAPTQLQLGL